MESKPFEAFLVYSRCLKHAFDCIRQPTPREHVTFVIGEQRRSLPLLAVDWGVQFEFLQLSRRADFVRWVPPAIDRVIAPLNSKLIGFARWRDDEREVIDREPTQLLLGRVQDNFAFDEP